MANKKAEEFMNKVLSDEKLKAQLADKSSAQAAKVAAELGYSVTAEEIAAAEKELRKQNSPEVVELDLDDMDKAAGGKMWLAENASDGHEMGCILFYHDHQYSMQHNEWCKSEYFGKAVSAPGVGLITPEIEKEYEKERLEELERRKRRNGGL
ncbi:MAG: Nif11-like leader peptide family natural product precursor [Ruminococcus sp.]|nr:Nif11-like leader peptide family natural product precursor [Ruminococcus sp.]